jgi:hypothetical protein
MRCSFGEYSPHATTVSSLLARRFKRCTGWLSYEEWIVVMVTPTDILYSALSNLDFHIRYGSALYPIDINSRVPQPHHPGGNSTRHTLVC